MTPNAELQHYIHMRLETTTHAMPKTFEKHPHTFHDART